MSGSEDKKAALLAIPTIPLDVQTQELIAQINSLVNREAWVEVEPLLRTFLGLFPENLTALAQLLYSLHVTGRQDEAYRIFEAIEFRDDVHHHKEFAGIYNAALRASGARPVPFERRARFRTLASLLASTSEVDGEVVECGCFAGMSSFMLCSILRAERPQFDGTGYHIYDSFKGLSDPMPEDDVLDDLPGARRLRTMSRPGHFRASLETVRSNLAAFPNISYHPGWIPYAFPDEHSRRYRFVHVDVDLHDPTWDSLEYFYPRMTAGGLIVSDDYSWPGARRAIEDFCSERKIEFIVTSTEQAVLKIPAQSNQS